MQAVRNHTQIVASCDRLPPALAPGYHDPAARARNGDYSAFKQIILARYDTNYEYMQGKVHTKASFLFWM